MVSTSGGAVSPRPASWKNFRLAPARIRLQTPSLGMNARNQSGLTWTEVLICLGVVGVLVFLALPTITSGPSLRRGQMTQTLSNIKQLHLATTQMAMDGVKRANSNLGWPGDTGATFSHWANALVEGGYLTTQDLCKLLSGPGRVVRPTAVPSSNSGAAMVYAVKEDSAGTAVFLTSGNFTNTPKGGTPLDPRTTPYGDKGFVVFRKSGDGAILRPKHAGDTNLIGSYVPLCQ